MLLRKGSFMIIQVEKLQKKTAMLYKELLNANSYADIKKIVKEIVLLEGSILEKIKV